MSECFLVVQRVRDNALFYGRYSFWADKPL